MTITTAQLRELEQRGSADFRALQNRDATAPQKRPTRGGYDSKTEAAYAEMLEAMRLRGEIVAWMHQPMTFVLDLPGENRKGCRYTPDFLVVTKCWEKGLPLIEFVETKGGFIREDAMLKFRWARKTYPWFKWTMMQRAGKGRAWEDITP